MDFLTLLTNPWTQRLLALTVGLVAVRFFFTMRRKKDLKGKLVLVTGGGNGIGRLMAHNFAKEGARLVLWDIFEAGMNKVAEEVTELGAEVATYRVDVSDRNNVFEVAKEMQETHGDLDILVNNAGIVTGKSFLDASCEAMERTMKVNTMAHFWTLKAFLPRMVENKEGHIVTIASTMGFCPSPGLADYCASKFAAVGFHDCIRQEMKKKETGVDTLLVCPWAINTGMFKGLKLKYQLLTPFLEETYVARRVVDSVKSRRELLIMPFLLSWLPFLMRLLPVAQFDAFCAVMGGASAMDDFQGRGSPATKKRD